MLSRFASGAIVPVCVGLGWLACSVDNRNVSTGALQPFGNGGASGASAVSAAGANSAPGAPVASSPPSGAAGANSGVASGAAGAMGGAAGAPAAVEPAPAPSPSNADAGPSEFTLSGRVLDFYRRPVPNVSVRVGDTLTATDASGAFSIPNVTTPYDVALLVNAVHFERPVRYGYRYEGLTRHDPTLQVYDGLPEHDTSLTVTVANADFSLAQRSVVFTFSSPDARYISRLDSQAAVLGATGWSGPSSTVGTAHALMLVDADGSGDIPTSFESHQSATIGVSDAASENLLLDMAAGVTPGVANLSGTVSGGNLGARENFVSLRFTDGTSLTFVDDTTPAAAFSYLVPSLPGSTLIFAAADGFGTPYTVVHREQLSPGQAGLGLTVPNPVNLTSPAATTDAAVGAAFSWSSLGQTAHTFVWRLQFTDTFDELFVITAGTSIELSPFADGSTWAPGTAAAWSVQTHGDLPDVDAMTGATGFMDSFSYSFSSQAGAPVGPNQADGYFTESEQRDVTLR